MIGLFRFELSRKNELFVNSGLNRRLISVRLGRKKKQKEIILFQ